MTSESDNPYRVSPLPVEPAAESIGSPVRAVPTMFLWVFVFAANLPMPILFGTAVVDGLPGYTGMLIGCLILCGSGSALCFGRRAWLVHSVSMGGILTALSQFEPLLQIFSGMIAISIVGVFSELGSDGVGRITRNMGDAEELLVSILLTLLTGLEMIFVAGVAGLVPMVLWRWAQGRRVILSGAVDEAVS